MKLISWNVNGLRAAISHGFTDTIKNINPDVLCLQEIKMERGQGDHGLEGYHEYWNSAFKKGYSGTAVFTKIEPKAVTYGIGIEEHDAEGRVITLDFGDYYLVNCYTPNSRRELERLSYRMQWETDFLAYLQKLDKQKPVILCGDLNVAHEEIDIKNAKSNRKNAGFTDDERRRMTELLAAGFADTFREMHPDVHDAYTWWSRMAGARERNVGWRVDYFITSRRLFASVKSSFILNNVYISDHCPLGIEM